MYIKYVFGRDWPSKSAGTSFTVFSSYGIAKANRKNSVEILMKKNTTSKEYDKILRDYFNLIKLKNYNIKFIENKFLLIDKTTSFYIKAFQYLKNEAKNKRLDVIITRKVGFLPYAYYLKKKYNVTVIFEAHDYYLDTDKKRKKYMKKKLFQNWFLPKIDGILTHLKTMEQLYKSVIPEQNYLLARTGINKVYKYENKKENIIAYIGSLERRKKISDIFEALQYIKEIDIKLIIIGGKNKKEIEYYSNKAKDMGIYKKIEITGWVKRKKIDEILQNVKLGIVPLEENFFNKRLTSPMKVFNYFSHGIPVIGTKFPTLEEIINDKRGMLYEANNSKDLAQKIIYLINNEDEYLKIQKNIYNFNKELFWDYRGKKILSFIRNVKSSQENI